MKRDVLPTPPKIEAQPEDVSPSANAADNSITIRGLTVGPTQLRLIRELLGQRETLSRTSASQTLCDLLNYRQPNGWPKERAMRDILRRLEICGLVTLPPPLVERRGKASPTKKETTFIESSPISSLGDENITVSRVVGTTANRLWNQLIEEHHYLGRRPIVGRNLKQLVYVGERPIACLAWADPCLKLAPRDAHLNQQIGTQRSKPEHGINNTRFLILPWVAVPNLASRVLSTAIRHARDHWDWYYHADLAWAETFVDPSRFQGTCYLAANWAFVGMTKGTSRSGASTRRIAHGQEKHILVYTFGVRRKRVG